MNINANLWTVNVVLSTSDTIFKSKRSSCRNESSVNFDNFWKLLSGEIHELIYDQRVDIYCLERKF